MNPVTDPVTGIVYRSQVDFCRATGIAESTFAARKRRKSVPPELLGYTGNLQKIPAKDHEGRILVGWSLEKALTTGSKYERLRENLVLQGVADHTGRLHVSKREMCKFWGVRYPLYCTRRVQGMSLADALLTPDDRFAEINSTTDHEGRKFPTIRAMCEHWQVAISTYQSRVRCLGWSKERALTAQKDMRYARNRKKS